MKVSIICHGNIARSQILHQYLAEYAGKDSFDIDLFSCGTAPIDAYAEVESLLSDVQNELTKRGLKGIVKRDILDEKAEQHLADSYFILVADNDRKQEVLSRLGDKIKEEKIMLFYEFIGEGKNDFIDTYDANIGAQDPERFSRCFDELERVAGLVFERIKRE